jgi:LacI family transcriptional regulator
MRLTDSLIDAGVQFDAIITPNEILARGVLTALGNRGIKVPDKCKVVSLGGGINSMDFFSPKLTAIDYQPYTLGEEAMKMLTEIIQKKRIRPSHIILPAKLNRKQTT